MSHAPVAQPAPEPTKPAPDAAPAPEDSRAPGRPSKYDTALLDLARRCGKAGLIDEQIAIMLGIAPSTVYAWLKAHPEFSEAVKEGATDPKARLRNTMFQKAVGFTVPEEKVFLHEGKPVRVETYRYIPPSDTMAIFLACNWIPEEFKHIQHIQNAGGMDLNVKGTIPTAFANQMDRVLAAMGERPVGRTPAAARPAPAPAKPKQPAPPPNPKDLADEEEIPLESSPMDEDPNPPTDLDLSELEGGNE